MYVCNCAQAKKIRCERSCHNMNHDAANREGMPKLDELLELDGLEIGLEDPGRLEP